MNRKIFIFFIIYSLFINIKSDTLEISFDNLFPESSVQKIQKRLNNLCISILNAPNFENIEKNLLEELIDVYVSTYLLEPNIKRSSKSSNNKEHVIKKNDMCYLIRFVEYTQKNLNDKFFNFKKIYAVNLLFDKISNQLKKLYNTNELP